VSWVQDPPDVFVNTNRKRVTVNLYVVLIFFFFKYLKFMVYKNAFLLEVHIGC
jgi:hypothetical protein